MPLGNKRFENTVGKAAISPLPTVFSTSLENFQLFTSNWKLSSADCFNLDQFKILSSGNGSTLYQMKFLDGSKLKAFPDEQNKCNLNTEILFEMSRKQCGKWRKCWLAAFLHFPH